MKYINKDLEVANFKRIEDAGMAIKLNNDRNETKNVKRFGATLFGQAELSFKAHSGLQFKFIQSSDDESGGMLFIGPKACEWFLILPIQFTEEDLPKGLR